jgi:hypothetical protein
LGVGREANNLTPEKTTLFRNLIEAKNGLIFWSDTGGRFMHTGDDWKTVVKEAKVLQGL